MPWLDQTKECRGCGQEKPMRDYYEHPQMADGHLNYCKDCVKARVRRHRRLNDRVREYDRSRADDPDRAALRARISKEWRAANPQAYKAHTAVGNAIRDGKLKKEPCAFCGADESIHAHHRDYSQPLDVVWVCAKCHRRLHALFPELEGHERKRA